MLEIIYRISNFIDWVIAGDMIILCAVMLIKFSKIFILIWKDCYKKEAEEAKNFV